MLAPQPGSASYTLLLSPDHVGTGVPLLLLWLIIDRARPRWYVPVTAGVLLAWVQVADSVTLIIGVAPVVIACWGLKDDRLLRTRLPPRRPPAGIT